VEKRASPLGPFSLRSLSATSKPSMILGKEMKPATGKAFIPAANGRLQGLRRVNQELVASIQQRHPAGEATLDTMPLWSKPKRKMPFSAIRDKAYQPFNVGGRSKKVVLHNGVSGMGTSRQGMNSCGYSKRPLTCSRRG